jgi:DNA-binding transcriptional ArsR family regulator
MLRPEWSGELARHGARVAQRRLLELPFNYLVDNKSRPSTFNHVVELSDSRHLDSVFHALGDATRRRMLRELSEGARTVSQLAGPFDMSLAAASKHIKTLEGAGLIRREVRGRTHVCHLDPGPLANAKDWLAFYERFWTGRLDTLEQLLRDADAKSSERETR